jgi:hypothetical protein
LRSKNNGKKVTRTNLIIKTEKRNNMNILKQNIVIGIVILMSSSLIARETVLTNEEKAKLKLQLTEYFEELDLSEEQKPKFKEIVKKYALQMKTLKISDNRKFAKRRKFKSIKKSKNKEMKVLLNTEQYQVYKKKNEGFFV